MRPDRAATLDFEGTAAVASSAEYTMTSPDTPKNISTPSQPSHVLENNSETKHDLPESGRSLRAFIAQRWCRNGRTSPSWRLKIE
jgi:hypothetical protein